MARLLVGLKNGFIGVEQTDGSRNEEKGDREACLAAGCTAYLTKPIKQDVLLQAIKDYSTIASPLPQGDDRLEASRSWQPSARLAARVPAYLDSCRQHVVTMGDALDRADFEAVTILGHNMRGSGSAFGFQAITNFGADLEQAAEASDIGASRRLVDELSIYLADQR